MSGPQLLTGWGRTSPTRATVLAAADLTAVRAAVRGAGDRGIVARGLGRSYGDAAQNGGGTVVRLPAGRIGPIDPGGLLDVDAGVSLAELLAACVPQGWFPAALPGTRQVTVGGAIAADVHGKNHPQAGSFGTHVRSLDLMDGSGEIRTLTPGTDPDAFWATVGGMGLTGVVVAARLALTPLPSAWFAVRTRRTADLAGAFDALADDGPGPYAAAWVDTLSTGRRAGRCVVTTGRPLPAAELGPDRRASPLRTPPARSVTAPRLLPPGVLSAPTARAFNELWFRRARDGAALLPWDGFLQPLDRVAGWNRCYGPRGFVQYQMVAPRRETVAALVERMAAARVPSFLAVLKRLGAADPGPLSFPQPGWSLAVDIPAQVPGLRALLAGFDALVAAAGGRVYLAKDSRLEADVLATMYPQLPAWRQARDALDPAGRFRSDLGRRLGLLPGAAA